MYSRGWLESVSQIITYEFALPPAAVTNKDEGDKNPRRSIFTGSAGLIVNPVVQEDADQSLAIIIYLELS